MSGTCDGTNSPGTYCSNPATGLGSSGNFYFERNEGWGNPRSEGDPFTPSPNAGRQRLRTERVRRQLQRFLGA